MVPFHRQEAVIARFPAANTDWCISYPVEATRGRNAVAAEAVVRKLLEPG